MTGAAGQVSRPETVIEASGLASGYGGRIVWSGADFTVGAGEFLTVLGPNGAGKSTLLRMLLGLLPPAGGELRVFGGPPRRGNPSIGYVPQRRALDPELTIGAADLVHGETGDDTIHGELGDDVLFGEGQDDDIVGGYGDAARSHTLHSLWVVRCTLPDRSGADGNLPLHRRSAICRSNLIDLTQSRKDAREVSSLCDLASLHATQVEAT